MNKWYQSAACKGILIVLEHVMAAVMVICLVWTLSYPGGDIGNALLERPEKEYADSRGFERLMRSGMNDILWAAPQEDKFETDGVFDEKRIVDIPAYEDSNNISGENKSGFAYYLGDILKWKNNEVRYGRVNGGADNSDIIVCQKTDGTFRYYNESDFAEAIEDGKLKFGNLAVAEENYGLHDDKAILHAMLNSQVDAGDAIFKNIQNEKKEKIYNKCWIYEGARVDEEFAPIGRKDILELVNEDPAWNGRLNDAMESLSFVLYGIRGDVENWKAIDHKWQEGNTNAAYLLVDLEKNRVYTNRMAYQKADEWRKSLESIKKLGKYVVVTPKLVDFDSNIKASAEEWRQDLASMRWTEDYVCAFAVDTEYPIQDQFYQESQMYMEYAPMVRGIFTLGVSSAIILLIAFVWLTIISGHSNKEEGIRLNVIDRMKTEIFLLIAGFAFAGAVVLEGAVLEEVFFVKNNSYVAEYAAQGIVSFGAGEMIMTGGAAVLVCAAGLILWLGMARRLKAHTVWENSILKWFLGSFRIMAKHMNLIWKAVLAFCAFVLIHWIALAVSYDTGVWFFLMLAAEVTAFVYLIRGAIGKNRIKKGVEAIAGGQVDYQIPMDGLKGDLLEVAAVVNMIGDGLDKAVEESMKNERLKTDLITNVSHDIKTPLTSIINYVEILKREKFENPKVQEYLKVLEEKAYRLKTLTEDVVEASKVSSGNVNLEMMNLNLVELINQTCAEFEEKFEDRNLHLVLNMPGEPVNIYADGRRMWRVLANIFNNAAKYAMEGTRIYADLYQTEKEVQFTLKNVSAQALNISADELTERFIRGDVSRSTEGSGLGLSIAQNLTKLQGGTFELYLDGDLFKVLIRFPRNKKVSEIKREE